MAITVTIPYDNPSNFAFNASELSVTDRAQLIEGPVAANWTQDFSDDTGFTYDPLLLEFLTSPDRVDQIARVPQGILGANFNAGVDPKNANWVTAGSGIGNLNGSPTFSGGVMSCVGTQGVYYEQNSRTSGTAIWRYTPNYSGGPATNVNLFSFQEAAGLNDRFTIFNSPSGDNIRVTLNESDGTAKYTATTLFNWNPTSGQTYVFQLDWDSVAGVINIRIDGVLQTNIPTITPWTRGTGAGRYYLGAAPNVYNTADADFDDFILYSAVQGAIAVGYSVPDFLYPEARLQLPIENVDTALSYISLVLTATGARATVNGFYWNGAAWIETSNTFATASTATDITTNFGSFPSVTTAIQVDIFFGESNIKGSIEFLTFGYNLSLLPVSSSIEYIADPFNATSLSGFSADIENVSDTSIGFNVAIFEGGSFVKYYWDSSTLEWRVAAAGETNTIAELDNNLPSLDLGTGRKITWDGTLNSDTPREETPELKSITFGYERDIGPVVEPVTTIIKSFARDLTADKPTATDPVNLIIEWRDPGSGNQFFAGDTFIYPSKKVVPYVDGEASTDLVTTSAYGTRVFRFTFTYVIDGVEQTGVFGDAVIPAGPEVNIKDLIFT